MRGVLNKNANVGANMLKFCFVYQKIFKINFIFRQTYMAQFRMWYCLSIVALSTTYFQETCTRLFFMLVGNQT